MQSAEIFAGCGGLALGMSRAGFRHRYMAEFDQDAVATVLHNKAKGVEHVRDWPMGLQDVREIDWKALPSLDLVSGGPPCQPFGIGGKKHGQDDHRDMWPEASVISLRERQEYRWAAFPPLPGVDYLASGAAGLGPQVR
jgi:DNA (cytosine-5)-methyltransferase 1